MSHLPLVAWSGFLTLLDVSWTPDWSAINTALLLAAIVYLYRQARMVDQVRQVLLGFGGHGGVLVEVKLLRQRSHDLASKMAELSGTVEQLISVMQERRLTPRPPKPGDIQL